MAPPSAPTVSLAVDDELDVVTVTVGVPAAATVLYVQRVVDGSPTYVRGGYALDVSPSSSVDVVDYEAPIGVEVSYRAFVENASSEQSAATTAGPETIASSQLDDPWLVDLADPANTQQVTVERLTELVVVVPTGVHYIIGRRSPIVTGDVAKLPSFELAFVTFDDAARDRARAALSSGNPILLRTPPEQGVGELYLMVLGWVEQRVVRVALFSERRFIVQGQEVDAPPATLYAPAGAP